MGPMYAGPRRPMGTQGRSPLFPPPKVGKSGGAPENAPPGRPCALGGVWAFGMEWRTEGQDIGASDTSDKES